MPISYEKQEKTSSADIQYIDYWYKAPQEVPIEGKVEFKKENFLKDMWFSEDGGLFALLSTGVYAFNPNTGGQKIVYSNSNVQETFSIGGILCNVAHEEVILYDLQSKRELPSDQVLNELIETMGRNYLRFILSGGDNDTIFILGKEGMYRHKIGGGSIEQVITENNLQDNGVNLEFVNHIVGYENGTFLLPTYNGSLVQYEYGTVKRVETTTSLEVYELMAEYRNQRWPMCYTDYEMPVAIKKYNKLHPEVEVKYTLACDYRSKNPKLLEDVIKELNLEIAAGRGPDILLLNGLPIDSYIKKGMLEDISDIVHEVNESEGILDGILNNYTSTEGSIYCIPLGFTLNMMYGPKKFVERATSFSGLVTEMEEFYQGMLNTDYDEEWYNTCYNNQYRTIYDNNFWYCPFRLNEPIQLIEFFANTCMPAWLSANGNLIDNKLLEFYTQFKKLYDVINTESNLLFQCLKNSDAKLKPETLSDWRHWSYNIQDVKSILDYVNTQEVFEIASCDGAGEYSKNGITGVTSALRIGELGGATGGFRTLIYSNEIGDLHAMGRAFGFFEGQSEHVYNPKRIVGISSTSTKKLEAKEFIKFLLSNECKYGVNTAQQSDETQGENSIFSVNKTCLEEDFTNSRIGLKYVVTEEYINRLRDEIYALNTPGVENRQLLNAVTEAGVNMVWAGITPEQAVEEVKEKMDLYLME